MLGSRCIPETEKTGKQSFHSKNGCMDRIPAGKLNSSCWIRCFKRVLSHTGKLGGSCRIRSFKCGLVWFSFYNSGTLFTVRCESRNFHGGPWVFGFLCCDYKNTIIANSIKHSCAARRTFRFSLGTRPCFADYSSATATVYIFRRDNVHTERPPDN